MAPWSNRLLSASSSHELRPDPAEPIPASPARIRIPSRLTEADILENAYGIPTLPLETPSSSSSNSRRTASHGRSMSHPFPSLFTGRRKQHDGATSGFDSTDDDSVSSVLPRSIALSPGGKQSSQVPDRDLVMGKCMTCDSMVRWPKDLKVFRCTVCLTINDLKPVLLETRRGDGHRAVKTATHTISAYPHHGRLPNMSL
jgi:E3 ubiquitin-protein ligase HECTD2